jgi:hypothetical protein
MGAIVIARRIVVGFITFEKGSAYPVAKSLHLNSSALKRTVAIRCSMKVREVKCRIRARRLLFFQSSRVSDPEKR